MKKSERNAKGEVGKKRGRRSRRETRKEKTERNAGGGEEKETFRKRNPEQISRPAPD